MFEGFLEKFLLKYFGEYLKGIDKSNLSVAVWKGEISVKTVDINPEILKKLNFPFRMALGKIDSLLLKVPWNNLSGKPVELTIENISIVLAVEDVATWYAEKEYLDFCEALVGDIKNQVTKKLDEELEKQEKKSSFFEQIFDNLIINVKNINIRVEFAVGHKFCFGGILEDFNIRSVDKSGNPVFIKRVHMSDPVTKKISFKNLVLYHDKNTVSEIEAKAIDEFIKKSSLDDFHKIFNLNLDLMFTLAPYDKKNPESAKSQPIYLLETEVNCVELVFETSMIRDMTSLIDYFDHHKNTQLEYLDRQKFNHLKPLKRVKDTRDASEKKLLVKSWWKFAFRAVKLERRSKLSGINLTCMKRLEKVQKMKELERLMILQGEGQLEIEKVNYLSWLLQCFNYKDITEVIKTVSYESYKLKGKMKKDKYIDFQDISLFDLEELPDLYEYFLMRISMHDCRLVVKSDSTTITVETKGVYLEQKTFTLGNESTLNVGNIQALIQQASQRESQLVCYGRTEKQDILSMYIRTEKKSRTVVGRIRRVHFYYKSEIVSLINSFIEVFEDNATLASKFRGDTQAYLDKNTKNDPDMKEIVNVKIEAPLILMPESQRFWIVDLGTFDITKAGADSGKSSNLVLEGKSAKVYFAEANVNLDNLNQLVSAPDLLADLLPRFSLVVNGLEFAIDIGKTDVNKDESIHAVDSVNFAVQPFNINLIDNSLKSLLILALKLSEETKREKAFIDKVMKNGEIVSSVQEIEYDIGYEVWEECDIILEGQQIHIVSHQNKMLSSQNFDALTSIGLDQKDQIWVLSLTFKRKKVVLRSYDRKCLTELKFKIGTILSIIESDENREKISTAKSFNNDYIMNLKFTEIVLTVQNYYKNTTPFEIDIKGMLYSSEYIDGVEVGNFQFLEYHVSDFSDKGEILKFVSDKQDALASMTYDYTYKEGSLDSNVIVSRIELTYKVQYVQSLMKLSEIIIEYLAEGQKTKVDKTPSRIHSQQASILDDPIIRKCTTIQKIRLTCKTAKIDLYYKKDIKSVCLLSRDISVLMNAKGLDSSIVCELKQIECGSYLTYPYRSGSNPLTQAVPMIYLQDSGNMVLKITIKETDTSRGLFKSELDCHVIDLVVDWIQQPMLRYFDFVLYQMLEVFYPSLLSFSKFYNKENIIKQALKDLNDSYYLKKHLTLTNCWVLMPSTIEPSRKLKITIDSAKVSNSRGYLPKIANKDQLIDFPFEELESDIWNVDLRSVGILLVNADYPDGKACIRDRIDMNVSVNYPTKLFELSFLYDIEDDLLCFDIDSIKRLHRMNNRQNSVRPKESLSLDELRCHAIRYINGESSREKIYVDGRYHLDIRADKMELLLTNQLVNTLAEILGNNITFDDGMDALLTNTYVTTEKGLQLYTKKRIDEVICTAVNYGDLNDSLFSISLGEFCLTSNRRSDFAVEVDFHSDTIQANFEEFLQIPEKYRKFFKVPEAIKSMMNTPSNAQSSNLAKQFKGSMKITPDGNKDIEFIYDKAHIIVFSFMTRFIVELLSLDDIPEHHGFEDSDRRISFLLKVKDAELCLVSNEESCIIIKSNL